MLKNHWHTIWEPKSLVCIASQTKWSLVFIFIFRHSHSTLQPHGLCRHRHYASAWNVLLFSFSPSTESTPILRGSAAILLHNGHRVLRVLWVNIILLIILHGELLGILCFSNESICVFTGDRRNHVKTMVNLSLILKNLVRNYNKTPEERMQNSHAFLKYSKKPSK